MEQQLTVLANKEDTVTPVTVTGNMSTKQIVDNMPTSQDRVVAATLLNTQSNTDSDSSAFDSTASTASSSYYNSTDSASFDSNGGIGPLLDVQAYNRFEATLAKLQVHASDIVRVDNATIGTGGFAKMYKVLLRGNQLCAAKVSDTVRTCFPTETILQYLRILLYWFDCALA
jgi:leucyl-tRNA synthetase